MSISNSLNFESLKKIINKMQKSNLLAVIESKLGSYNKLPNYPFNEMMALAIFPGLDDDLVDERLYKALYKANNAIDNTYFITKAIVSKKGEDSAKLQQAALNWRSFDEFQSLPLVYKGFYMTGENINWLGIYHVDDYIVIGSNDEFIEMICNEIYGHNDWLSEFEKAFESGRMNMYKDDYESIKDSLLK
jgi:hypothetical protein